jgi:hypothetical protein
MKKIFTTGVGSPGRGETFFNEEGGGTFGLPPTPPAPPMGAENIPSYKKQLVGFF